MIPRIIHYCWFGCNPLPNEYIQYMDTWRKYCPDYEIRRWDESNFDINQNQYCREAYQNKKWAFVSDYARLKIIYENGGIYLDTDVEVLRDLTVLISSGVGFIGFQNSEEINTGLGFAAEKHNPCVKTMLDIYEKRKFIIGGKLNLNPCPAANTVGLIKCGLKTGRKNTKQVQYLDGINVYPIEYFNPCNTDDRKVTITENTFTYHHYSGSWFSRFSKMKKSVKKILPRIFLDYRTERVARQSIQKIYRELQEDEH